MSHLIEEYALQTSSKITLPELRDQFYPIPNKYITLQASSSMPGKNYDYWSLVIDQIAPQLAENGIKIVQIGGKEDVAIKGCIPLQGQTSLNQSFYIIKNALCHVGNDSFAVHAASVYDIPIVGIFSISPVSICGPYFGNKSRQICIEPEMGDKKFSFNPNENPKKVNTIKPEQIVEAIGKLLNIDFPKFETIFIGSRYNVLTTELIPNCQIPPAYFPNQQISIRADWTELTPEILNNIYSTIFARPCSLRTDKPIDLNPIIQNPQIKKNLAGIVLDLSTDSFSEEYVKSLLDNQIKFILAWSGNNEEDLKKLKLKFCEYGVIQKFEKENGELRKILDAPGFSPDKTFAKSQKILISENKMFLNKTACDDKMSIEQTEKLEFPVFGLRNYQSLPEDSDFLCLYRKI